MQEEHQAQPPEGQWQYNPEDAQAAVPPPSNQAADAAISWSASEFIAHDKTASWFVVLGIGSILVVGIIYVLTNDVLTASVVALAAIIFGVAANRKPRTLDYGVDETGIHIGQKSYPYNLFKSFSIIEEGAFSSITLMPLKRFMPPISLYYPPDQEHKIADTLSLYLPHEERTHDAIDRLMRKVRF